MRQRKLIMMLTALLVVGVVSSVSAATSWKRLSANPFYRPSLSSTADLKTLVKNRSVDLKAGFTKAGDPGLYPAFIEQFPAAKVDSITVAPGETFEWMVFKKKSSGRVTVLKDVSWKGAAAFEAYRFTIDKDGKRYEFVIPYACGNVALRSVAAIPPPVAVSAPAPAPVPVAPAPPAVAPPPPPVAKPAPPPVVPQPVVVAQEPTVVHTPAAPAAVSPMPPPRLLEGLLLDVGLSWQADPANYGFARVGYEFPIVDRLSLIGMIGGAVRLSGHDGGSAFTADAMLDYHWLGRMTFGLGAGLWSGNDGQVDLIANIGCLVFGRPDNVNGSLFIEGRLPFDEFDNASEFGRYGLGMRFRF